MKHGIGLRVLALSVALSFLFGCNDDDDGGAGSGSQGGLHGETDPILLVEFFDDFSGPFPSPNWKIKSGDPFTSPDAGNAAPGLALLSFGGRARVRSAFTFSASEPLTLSFDLANPEWKCDSRFKFRIRRAQPGAGVASFEIRLDQDEIRLKIEDSYAEMDYASDGAYHAVEFTMDASGAAAWRVGGQTRLSRAGFPGGKVEIEMEATGDHVTKFVVDNVRLTRP